MGILKHWVDMNISQNSIVLCLPQPMLTNMYASFPGEARCGSWFLHAQKLQKMLFRDRRYSMFCIMQSVRFLPSLRISRSRPLFLSRRLSTRLWIRLIFLCAIRMLWQVCVRALMHWITGWVVCAIMNLSFWLPVRPWVNLLSCWILPNRFLAIIPMRPLQFFHWKCPTKILQRVCFLLSAISLCRICVPDAFSRIRRWTGWFARRERLAILPSISMILRRLQLWKCDQNVGV